MWGAQGTDHVVKIVLWTQGGLRPAGICCTKGRLAFTQVISSSCRTEHVDVTAKELSTAQCCPCHGNHLGDPAALNKKASAPMTVADKLATGSER